ncbi:WD40 repeat protein [Scheffersomyces xylosifermentans]|uniref:WD40 repeat protein n=1 Tax=Scheffersomyces xylosifermentans TaxID=1304137 RepID=UPI00315CA5DB
MVWVSSCPKLSVALLQEEKVLKLIHVPHTPLLIVLTKSTFTVYDQHTLLPIATHHREQESITKHGFNTNIKTKHVSVNTAQLQKLHSVNLFLQTDSNYLIIYSMVIVYSKSLFEVSNSVNEELIQTGLPLSITSQKNSFGSMIRSATKAIVQGQESHIDLENVESFNNYQTEDELGNYTIEQAKLTVFKILKVGIGLERYWLKSNSHNLIVFNSKNERQNDTVSSENIDSSEEGNFFHLLNMQNFRNELFVLSESDWYPHGEGSRIIYINYNFFQNYFLFLNERYELWYMNFEISPDSEVSPIGHKLYTLKDLKIDLNFKISFNPHSELLLFHIGTHIKLFKLSNERKTLEHLKDIRTRNLEDAKVMWASNGNYFVLLDKSTGYWAIYTKFGSATFNTAEVVKELDEYYEENRGFLRASKIIISPNSMDLFIISHDSSKFYFVSLLTNNGVENVFYDHEYISIIQNNKTFSKFPIQPKFKRIMEKIECYNGISSKSLKSINGNLTISRSDYDQFAISYGDSLAISTPFTSGGSDINNILWFNFRNYYLDSFNIVRQFWFNDYLVIVNRRTKEIHQTSDDDNGPPVSNEHLVDEIIVLDTTKSKYGQGGEDMKFDNDSTVWKYDFKTTFISIEPIVLTEHITNIALLTEDFRLIILELNDNKTIDRKVSTTDLQEQSTRKSYKIFIGVNKTIHLSSVKHKFSIKDVINISMIDKRHFFFLLNTGELYLLKNQKSYSNTTDSTPINALKPSNMYDLIKIKPNIEFFRFQSIKFKDSLIDYIYLFNGEELLIYELGELIDNAFDVASVISDGLDDERHSFPQHISIEIENFQPVILDSIASPDMITLQSLDLIGLESVIVNKPSNGGLVIKNRIAHKLVMNNFIEHDLINKATNLETACEKYKSFRNYHYCLELLLFKFLTSENTSILKSLFALIENNENSEYIYINCLRKIEVGYWHQFFTILNTTPVKFMNRLIEIDNVELCYNYLIIYLNYKKEGEDEDSPTESEDALNSTDKEIILKIMKMLDDSKKWDWCFELCRFIKLLQPSGDLLQLIKETLK